MGGCRRRAGGMPVGRLRRPPATGKEPKTTISGASWIPSHDLLGAHGLEARASVSASAWRQCGGLVPQWRQCEATRRAQWQGRPWLGKEMRAWFGVTSSSPEQARVVMALGLLVKKLHLGWGGHGPLRMLHSSAVAHRCNILTLGKKLL